MTYIVKKGDTLYGISNQFGVSVTELASINGVDANTLQIGQELIIPNKSGTNPNNMFLYTVVKGDTLYSIAKKYNTSVSAILDLNYLTSSNLSIGQVIRIPENYTPEDEIFLPQYKNYIVQKGDTLYSIAKKFQISVDVLIKDNALTTTVLYPGEVLRIRTSSEEVLECFGEDYIIPNNNDNLITYTVQRGDSLYSIARKFNTSVDQIMKLNNLSSNLLSIGQVLMIKRGI
ncbi:MAG: LysM peptidoglycan-binding domain-containing protein [Bacilli bacterium]|nr:LysM peptidoglycan-binding domain-containing protein [Bacilli bacterium]